MYTNSSPGAMHGVTQTRVHLSERPPTGRARGKRGREKPSGTSTAWETAEVPLRRDQVERAWGALAHPHVRMCFNEMTKRLFAGVGIVVYQGNTPRIPTDAFRTVLQRDFVPFDRDALDAIMTIGVVPIAFRKVPTNGLGEEDLVPYVPKFGTYTITTFSVDGIQRFNFYRNNFYAGAGNSPATAGAASGPAFWGSSGFGDHDPSVMVAHDFGYNPNVDGTLTSNLHAIAEQLSFISEMNGLAVTAERISSNPPLVTEYNNAIEDRAEDKFSENFYVGNPDRCVARAEAVYERNAQQQAAFRENMRLWEQYNGLRGCEEFVDGDGQSVVPHDRRASEPEGTVAPAWGRDWRGAEMPWSRQYYIGATRRHVQHHLPRARGDLVAMNAQAMDIVCGVLNVPKGMLSSDSHVRAGVEAVSEAMHRTVNRWADLLSHLMTAVYNHTFGVKDLRDELRIQVQRRRRSPYETAEKLLTEADLFAAEQKTRVRLAFDLPPSTSPERLDAMYNRGIIGWETYATAQLRLQNFARDQLASESDPLSKEEKKMLLFGAKPSFGKEKRKKTGARNPTALKEFDGEFAKKRQHLDEGEDDE